MNGFLKLTVRGRRHFVVLGGPYRLRPMGTTGVKMAKEIDAECTIDIPTVDYHVPPKTLLDLGLRRAVDAILEGRPVYVGCMGGMGRTGLFLAVLAKAWGVRGPVEYVRRNYYAQAVETTEQYAFVTKYKVPSEVRQSIAKYRRWARWWSWLPTWVIGEQLTELPPACREEIATIQAMRRKKKTASHKI